MFFNQDKINIPNADNALPVREHAIKTAETHYISGRKLKGPFPDQMAVAVFGLGCFWGAERKFWNIGAEGQLYCGAMAATLVGTGMIDLPAPLMIPMLFIAGAIAGCLILLVPVLLKTHMKVDEVIAKVEPKEPLIKAM